MILTAPNWLQPILWTAAIAAVVVLIVLIWCRLSPTVERLHVEGMNEHPRSWKRVVWFGVLLLLVVAAAAAFAVLAR